MSKAQQLLELAKTRQTTRYQGHTCIGDYDNGVWECDYVSPYSLSAHNVDADVMIVLQDWCSSDSFNLPVCQETLTLGHTPSVRTNINLKTLLHDHLGLTLSQTYSTNLFPFVKPGPMNASIPSKDLLKAAQQFTLPMINIIQPKLVISLGLDTFNTLRKACGHKKLDNLSQAIENSFEFENSRIVCQGQLGRDNRNRGGVDRVNGDWERLVEYVERTQII